MIRALPVLLAPVLLAGCQQQPAPGSGDKARGAALITRAQCGSCHVIPGIAEAQGKVGPPLAGMARRTIIAGVLPNTPDTMARWLRDPQGVVPGNAMPSSNLDQQGARDVAAYLGTLQ